MQSWFIWCLKSWIENNMDLGDVPVKMQKAVDEILSGLNVMLFEGGDECGKKR